MATAVAVVVPVPCCGDCDFDFGVTTKIIRTQRSLTFLNRLTSLNRIVAYIIARGEKHSSSTIQVRGRFQSRFAQAKIRQSAVTHNI